MVLRKMRKRYGFGAFFVFAVALMLLLQPQAALNGARMGLGRWWDVVLPSLLPFMVMGTLLMDSPLMTALLRWPARALSAIFGLPSQASHACMLGALGGYPLGARLGGELYERGEITERDLLLTLLLGNLCGPVFIVGAVSTGFLGNAEMAVPMLLGYYLSVWLTGLLFSKILPRNSPAASPNKHANNTRGMDFSLALVKSLNAMFCVLGCMMLASALIGILEPNVIALLQEPLGAVLAWLRFPKALSGALLQGLLEMTTGCAYLSDLSLPLGLKAAFSVGICAFGGVSIFLQTCAMAKVKIRWLALGKLVNAVIAAPLTYALAGVIAPQSVGVFAPVATRAPGNQWIFALVLFIVTGIPLTVTALYAHLNANPPKKQKPAG